MNDPLAVQSRWPRRLCLTLLSLVITPLAQAGHYLGELTWPEAEKLIPQSTVVIPFAAGAKEHGPHLPLATDQLVLDHLLAAAVREANVVVAPPILHGWFPAFRGYPGTEISDPTVFQNYVREVAESLLRHEPKGVVFLNTGIHLATGLPLSIVARDLKADHGVPTLVVSWDDLEVGDDLPDLEQERGGHADEGETSIVLHLRRDLVHMDRAQADYGATPREQIGYPPGGFDPTRDIGVFGDPSAASAEKGEKILDVMTRRWLEALRQFETRGDRDE